MLQTKITDTNKDDFYRTVYNMQMDGKSGLINLDKFTNKTCILIDCCGWHYKNIFPGNILSVEAVTTVQQFKLEQNQFDKLFDNRNDSIRWPGINVVNENVLVFDRSPILKYRSVDQQVNLITSAGQRYNPSDIIIRHSLLFVDESRITDVFYKLSLFAVPNYCVEQFFYDTVTAQYQWHLRRLTNVN